MRILIETTLLADSDLALGVVGPSGLTLNGEQLVDDVAFFRAAERTYYARGGFGVVLEFSVTRLFSSPRAAQAFALTHPSSVPLEGIVTVVCSDGDTEQNCYLAGAVVQAVQCDPPRGAACGVRYRIAGPKFTSDAPEDLPGEADDGEDFPVIRRGKVALDDEATSVDVVFSAPLSAVSMVVATVSRPSGGDLVWAILREDAITTAGFTADLSGPPGTGAYLHYVAFA